MNKIKINRYFLYTIPAICFILFVIAGNDRIALSIQRLFKAYKVFNIGNAVIKNPESWVLSYKKTETDSIGYLYGFFPVKDEHENSSEAIYIFKKVRTDNEVIFSELDAALKEKAKNVLLAFSGNSGKEKFEIVQVVGFKAIKFKYSVSEYSFNIPDLDLYIVTNSPDSLLDFNISKLH